MTCIAFDIDGTIFDCSNIIVEAFQRGISSFEKSGPLDIKMPSIEEIVDVLGVPTHLIFQKLFPNLTDHDQQKMNDLCTDALSEMIEHGGGELFDEVYPTFEKLKKDGYKIFAASNGRIEYISSILNYNGLMDFFSQPVIVLNGKINNKSDIVKYYIENECKGDLLIMIGDRKSDKIAADENNIPFIGCSFGHADLSELDGSKWIINKFGHIYKIIKEIENNFK